MGSDGMTFLTPKPRQYRSVLTALYPFGIYVWIAALATLFLIPFFMWATSKAEEMIIPNAKLSHWSSWGAATWYSFGTFIGESITRDTRSEGAWALRFIIGGWILLAFILGAGYGGNLRAFFLTPKVEPPVDSLLDVVENGLPWTMTITGEEIETYLANSELPLEKRLWDGKTVVPYSHFPHEQVLASLPKHAIKSFDKENFVDDQSI